MILNERNIVFLAPALLLTACGGGGGGGAGGIGGTGGGPTGPTPANLTYPAPGAHFLVDVPIEDSVPTVDGTVTDWSVSPTLPTGLLFDPTTGKISGQPTTLSDPSTFTITASGPFGSTVATIELGVDMPPAYAYVAHGDDTIGVFSVDAFDGGLTHTGLTFAPEFEQGAQDVIVHPSGRFAWVPNESPIPSSNDVSFYTVDTATGRLTAQSAIEFAEGRHSMALSPDGSLAFITSFHSHQIQAFAVDQGSGILTPLGTPLATGTSPERIVVDPLGRFVWVTNFNSRNLYVYPIDEVTGALVDGVDGLSFFTRTPTDMSIDPTGTYLYTTFLETEEIQRFGIDFTGGNHVWGPMYSTGGEPTSIVMHPTGRFAYVTNADDGTVSLYTVDAKDGDLVFTSNLAAGTRPTRVELDLSGNYAYVVDEVTGEIKQFKVNLTTGSLEVSRSLRTRGLPKGIDISLTSTPRRHLPRNVYTANTISADVSQLAIQAVTGSLTDVAPAIIASASPAHIALDPLERFAFVADGASNSVHRMLLDPTTGELTDDGLAVNLGGQAGGLDVDPSGRFLFVSVDGVHELRAYGIDPVLGTLSLESSVPTDNQPGPVSIDPTGRFIHLSGQFDIRTWTFSDGTFGASPHIVSAPSNPGALTFSPDGDIVFVPMRTTGLVIPYSVSNHDGALTAIVSGVLTLMGNPESLTLHPRGNHAYISMPNDGTIVHVAVDTVTGALTLVDSLTDAIAPVDLVATPNGSHVYATNQGGDEVLILAIDGDTGGLTLEGQAPAGVSPRDITLRTFYQ
jgi:6-phosphogluconolactonase